MKHYFTIILLLFIASQSIFAQNNYAYNPADTLFPFNIPLLSIDSTKLSISKTVMAVPKTEKEKKPTLNRTH